MPEIRYTKRNIATTTTGSMQISSAGADVTTTASSVDYATSAGTANYATTAGTATKATTAEKANKLTNTHSIWGNDFNGTQDVTGDLDLNESDLLNANNITTNNLEVLKQAHFFELVIDKVSAVGGRIVLSDANGTVDSIEDGPNYMDYSDHTFEEDEEGGITTKRVYFDIDENDFEFAVDDIVLCNKADVESGTDVSNKYYKTTVAGKGYDTDKSLSYIDVVISGNTSYIEGTINIEVGDSLVQLGNWVDTERQNLIILSTYVDSWIDAEIKAPCIVQYAGVDGIYTTIKDKRVTVLSPSGNVLSGSVILDGDNTTVTGNLNLYGTVKRMPLSITKDNVSKYLTYNEDWMSYELNDDFWNSGAGYIIFEDGCFEDYEETTITTTVPCLYYDSTVPKWNSINGEMARKLVGNTISIYNKSGKPISITGAIYTGTYLAPGGFSSTGFGNGYFMNLMCGLTVLDGYETVCWYYTRGIFYTD